MKKLLFAILICTCTFAFAGNKYYFSTSGSYSNSGTSPNSPWLNISHLDSITLNAGDTVFFKCGDTLRGSFKIKNSGTSSKNIVFTSYGTGAKPVISGAEKVSGWNNNAGIYSVNTTYNVKNFFANSNEMTLARYPNEGNYLQLDSAQKSYLKDAQIPQNDGYWNNASICIHTMQWCWEKTTVQSQTAGKVTFNTPTILAGLNKYGYFFYNKLEALDTAKEWFNDTTNNILYFKPTTGKTASELLCEISIRDYGIQTGSNVSYITISNLCFDKQYEAGVYFGNSNHKYINIQNCDFYRQYKHGIQTKGKYHELNNNYFAQVDGHGIDVNAGGKLHIHHNTFKKIGQYRNSGIGGETNLSAIAINFVDSCTIDHNNIDSTGYCGISADGAYHLIERNVVSHAMLLNNDGGAYKCYGAASHHNEIRNNFASYTTGNTEGCYKADFMTPGIYFDFNVNNCNIHHNTVYNMYSKGIFQNSGTNNNTISNNILFGIKQGIDLNGNPLMPTVISGDVIKHNVITASTASDILMRQVDYSNTFNFGTLDSNYYFQAYDSSKTVYRVQGSSGAYYGLKNYQALNGLDPHSKESFVHWNSSTNNYRIFVNISDNVSTINLSDSLYLDLDSNEVCSSIDLQPYTSVVLINTLTKCTTTSVEKIDYAEFSFYPNPANSEIRLRNIENPGASNYNIISTSGQIILTGNCAESTINISDLAQGMYFIQVISQDKSQVKTLIVD